MAPLTGFRLTLPDDTVFRVTKDVQTTPEQTTQFLFNGGQNALALYEQYVDDGGQSGRADSLRQTTALGTGAGIRTIVAEGVQYQDSGDQWGSASPGDSAVTKRDIIDNAIATTRISSEQPAELEFGEYSGPGLFSPIPIAIQQFSAPLDATDEASSFGVRLECLEVADLQQTIHGQQQNGG